MLRSTKLDPRTREGRWALALLAPLSLFGCIVDPDHACDENQTKLVADFGGCVCAPGSVVNPGKDGCTPCGENEEVKNGACACKTGFARPSATEACSASQQGANCSASTPCNGDFPYCAAAGYCTKSGCATNADCSLGGYACESTASPTYCSRPPVGQGKACSTPADCAGTEATYCGMGACLVTGCASTTKCHGDYACCDFTSLGAADFCLPASALSGGKCPVTNADPVTR
jgi:hypothetical protein